MAITGSGRAKTTRPTRGQIKCPNSATALDTWVNDTLPEKYLLQMHWQMACTNRAWCDYAVFDPRLPAKLQLYVKRVERQAELVTRIELEVVKFLAEMHGKIQTLKERFDV